MKMHKDDLKRYSVLVQGGSGCLFQPMSDLYTYILTAKHIFFEKKIDARGQEYKVQMQNGTNIEISRFIQIPAGWNEEVIPFVLVEGETFFPHEEEDADIAILKIVPAIKGFDEICIYEHVENEKELLLCGCPDSFRGNVRGNRYSDFSIERIISSANRSVIAQVDPVLNQSNIEGLSGGGILKVDDNHILIAGVQSKMANGTNYQAGQIAYVPIKFFNEIITNPVYSAKLTPLFPPYMGRFDLLKQEILKLESCIDPNFISILREKLLLKVDDIEVSPNDILNASFSNQLLMHNENENAINSKKLWTSWLEYLIVLQIVKEKTLSCEDIQSIFNTIRLIHTEKSVDWQRFMSDIFQTNLYGLNEKGILVVSSKKTPSKVLIEGEELITNIANANPVASFKTDNADIHPLQQFKFMHIHAFEKVCEDHEVGLKEYTGLNIGRLTNELKKIFDELLQN